MPAGLLPIIYLAFIALGLPDSAIGSAWPTMAPALGAGLSWVGAVSMIISAGTIVSSLMSVRVVDRFGTGRVTAVSVLLTAAALMGFSLSGEFWQLCLWAIPYGLGAGAVDAALNAYVAVHYKSQHMSWLHCMWGVGASGGPVIMSMCLGTGTWNDGFRVLGIAQLVIVAVLTLSLPLWKDRKLPRAASVDAIDIDEWAYGNCIENIRANGVEGKVLPVLGGIETIAGCHYDFIAANINRNILISHLPAYGAALCTGGWLSMSGILECDLEMLGEAARANGFSVTGTAVREGWARLDAVKM